MSNSNRTKLLLDIAIFAVFLVSMDPRSSGIPVHEWLAIAVTGTLIIHLLLNWLWIAELTARIFTTGLNGCRTNYILNWLLFIDGVLIMFSGIMISESVMPFFGIVLKENFGWRGLHDTSANLFLVILGLHLALHWNWIVVTTKRLLARRKSGPAPVGGILEKEVRS